MATKRTRTRRTPRCDLDPELLAWFKDEAPAPVETYFLSPGELCSLWNEHGPGIVAEWVETAPGTRPSAWWSYDAPRQPFGRYPGIWFDGQLPEPRQRLGGRGTPAHEVLAQVPAYRLGIPGYWIDDMWIVEHAHKAERFDPDDPPVFESQAAYLRRNKLLFEREGSRLTAAAFEPEALPEELWPAE